MNTRTRSIRTAPAKALSVRSDKSKPVGPARGAATKTPGRGSTAGAGRAGSGAGSSRRKLAVFVSLVGLLSMTSVLLLALAPDPLAPGSAASLFALDQPRSMEAVFDAGVPVAKGRWKSIFVHHSRTASGNADTLANRAGGLPDHFVIGNGAGCVDGEVQIGQRWSAQLPAGQVPGTTSIANDCVSICVVGDFDRTTLTPTQQHRLTQLVNTLQSRLGIGAQGVYLHQGTGTAADVGRRFPVAAFRERLLP